MRPRHTEKRLIGHAPLPALLAGKVDEKATQLHAIASLKVLLDATKPHNGAASTSAANHVGGLGALSETRLSVDQPNGILGGPVNDQGGADAVRWVWEWGVLTITNFLYCLFPVLLSSRFKDN